MNTDLHRAELNPSAKTATATDLRETVSIVVPCYNEKKGLFALSKALQKFDSEKNDDYRFEYIFVNDGSTDGTLDELNLLFGTWPNARIVNLKKNQGITGAILNGVKHARADIICTIDSDLSYELKGIHGMLDLLEPTVSVVTASPYHAKGGVKNVPQWRLVLSRAASGLYRTVLPEKLATYTSCFRLYRRSAFEKIQINERGFEGMAEILSKMALNGVSIAEYPTILGVRKFGESKMKILRATLGHLKLISNTAYQRWIEPEVVNKTNPVLPSDQEASGRTLGDEEIEAVAKAIRTGTLTSTKGSYVKTLETEFAKLLSVKAAHACASGTAAIHCAIAAIDPTPGDEIITTSITDMGALTPILYQGAIPVFADVDPHTYNVTAETIAKKITPKTKAIIVTHLFGNPCQMDEIMELANSKNIPVIEDCAQAFLTQYKGKYVGTLGAIGCFSLQQGKHMTTGEGGIVVSNNEEYARRMYLFINKAWGYGDPKPDHYFIALNYRMSELQGAVAVAQLQKLQGVVDARINTANELTDLIQGIPGIETPAVSPDDTCTYWKYCLWIDENKVPGGTVALANLLKAKGIASAPRYIQKPAYMCEVFQKQKTFGKSNFPFNLASADAVNYEPSRYPGTLSALNHILVLPWNEKYTAQHVEFIADSIRDSWRQLLKSV